MATNPIDRNAKSLSRTRRNFQRLANGGNQLVSPPLTSTGGTLALALQPLGGLDVVGGGLGVLLENMGGLNFAADGGIECDGFNQVVPANPFMGQSWYDPSRFVNTMLMLKDGAGNIAEGIWPIVPNLGFSSAGVNITPGTVQTPFGAPFQYTFPAGFLNVVNRMVNIRFFMNIDQSSSPGVQMVVAPEMFSTAHTGVLLSATVAAANQNGPLSFDIDVLTTATGTSGLLSAFGFNVTDVTMSSEPILEGSVTQDLTLPVTVRWVVFGLAANTSVATAFYQKVTVQN